MVTFKWNKGFWGEIMTSAALASALQAAADEKAAAAESNIGFSARADNFYNEDFYADVVTRHGKSSDYLVGLVRAGNPRSIYKSIYNGALDV